MISKVKYSKNLACTIKYIMNPQKGAHIVFNKGIYSATNLNQIIKDFEIQSQLRPNLKTKGVHIPISFHIKDIEKIEKYGEKILEDWLNHMELHGYRFDLVIAARHYDQDHKNPHYHLLVSTILDSGERANIANIGLACKQTSKAITEKWGLTPANHQKSNVKATNMNKPTQIPTYYVHKSFQHDSNEQIHIHDPTSLLLDLLLPIPATSYACSGSSSSHRKKDQDDDDKKKKKRKKK